MVKVKNKGELYPVPQKNYIRPEYNYLSNIWLFYGTLLNNFINDVISEVMAGYDSNRVFQKEGREQGRGEKWNIAQISFNTNVGL